MSNPFGTIELIVNPIVDECNTPAALASCIVIEAAASDGIAKFYEACGQGDRMLGRCAKTGYYCLGPVLYAEVLAILEGIDGIENQEFSLGDNN